MKAPAPSAEEIYRAAEIFSKWALHYYQLLFFQEPKLTSPGEKGRPFTVMHFEGACLYIVATVAPEYTFSIYADLTGDQQTFDKMVLDNCRMIPAAIKAGKQKVDKRVCCGLAETRSCVCAYSYKCPLHGTKCIGSHD